MYKLVSAIGLIAMMSIFFPSQMAWGQTYDTIYWDNHGDFTDAFYCSTADSAVCVPPNGASNITWSPLLTLHGNYLILPNGFDGQVDCFYTGGPKSLYIHPTTPLIPVIFPAIDTACGTGKLTFSLNNANASYNWYLDGILNSSHSQTFTTAVRWEGTIIGVATNACGSISDTVTIVNYNPNPPVLHDTTVCQGAPLQLNPGSYSTYHWTGGSTSPTYSPLTSGTYSVTVSGNGCTDVTAAQVTIVTPYTGQTLCYVTKNNNNINDIHFRPTIGHNIKSFRIMKEGSITGQFNLFKVLPYTGTNTEVVLPDTADFNTHKLKYNIEIVDSCDNISTLGGFISPTFIKVLIQGTNDYWMMIQPYVDENNPSTPTTLYIMSGNTVPLMIVDSIPGDQLLYDIPSWNTDTIFAGATLAQCVAKSNTLAYSNIVRKSEATGINELTTIDFAIYPNPTTDVINIQCMENVTITISSITGSLILSTDDKRISTMGIPSGLYLVKVVDKQTSISGYTKIIIY